MLRSRTSYISLEDKRIGSNSVARFTIALHTLTTTRSNRKKILRRPMCQLRDPRYVPSLCALILRFIYGNFQVFEIDPSDNLPRLSRHLPYKYLDIYSKRYRVLLEFHSSSRQIRQRL
ncbi:MAG: hypothetical protein ACI93R_002466 [Flavobacteriales bacterium]|jgi:hypothetical protein